MNAQQLRNSILQEAIEGRLVPQDPNDERASVLLERIREEKKRLVKEGKLKKKDLEETPITEDEKPFEIPVSWEWCRVSDLGEVITGSTPSKQNQEYYGDEYPFYKPGDLDKGVDICDSVDGLSQKGYDASRKLKAFSILVTCIGATIGKAGLIIKEGSCNQQINAIVPYNVLCPQYIYYTICSPLLQSIIRKDAGQTTLPIMNKNNFSKLLFPLPPLAEQKRIVAKIEKLMPLVEKYGETQEALEEWNNSLPEKLKKSILQEAIQGKLVPQDPADEPASALLERIREEKKKLVKEGKLKKKDLEVKPIEEDEIPFEIPKSWEWCHFGEIVNMQMGKTPPRGESLYWLNGTDSWVSISDMKDYGHIQSTKEKVSEYAVEHIFKKKSPEGTLLMSFKLTVGRTSILDIPAFHNEAIISIFPYVDTNDSFRNYLFYLLPLLSNLGDSKDAIKGKTLNSTSLNDLLIPLPPIAEQRRIVAKTVGLFELIGNNNI